MLYFLASSCATSYYNKSNGKEACGILLSSLLSYHQAGSACINLGARLPEPKSLAEMQQINTIAVIYLILYFYTYM